MQIQVLGSGCPTCKKFYEITQVATAELGLEAEIDYITGTKGMQKIIELGAMSSPLLLVNGKVAMVGFIPDVQKIKQKIQAQLGEDN